MLSPGLRILILFMLPFVLILLPIIAFIVALFGSLGYFVGYTVGQVFNCKNWFRPWENLPWGVREYWKWNIQFVKNVVREYDHMTGIPRGWDGTRYGIPFGPVKVVIGMILTVYGIATDGLGTFVIVTLKFVPINAKVFSEVIKSYFRGPNRNQLIAYFPFFLLGLCFMIVLSPVAYVVFIQLSDIATKNPTHVLYGAYC